MEQMSQKMMRKIIVSMIEDIAFNTDDEIKDYNEVAKRVGNYFREEREERELTQKELAEMAYLPIEDIKMIEEGKVDLHCAIYFSYLNRLDFLESEEVFEIVSKERCKDINNNPYIDLSCVLEIDLINVYNKVIKELTGSGN